MGLQGYLIEKYNCMSNSYTCRRLKEEADHEGVDLKIVGIHDTMITPHEIINSGTSLERRDFVINRYKWGKMKDNINLLAKHSYNNIDAFNIYINKYEQVSRLHSSAFEMPRYVMGTSLLKYEEIVKFLDSPFVAKGMERSMGQEILLIENAEDYKNLSIKFSKEKEWLFEEFIKSSIGKDIRFYSIRGEVIACMQRISQRDFRANVALGARVEPYEITAEIRCIAKDIYEQTGLDFLGIDLLEGIEKPYFCEINVMPGLEGIEAASGVNVANHIIKTINGDFENEQN